MAKQRLEDWCPREYRQDYRRVARINGGDAARKLIEDRMARVEKLKEGEKK